VASTTPEPTECTCTEFRPVADGLMAHQYGCPATDTSTPEPKNEGYFDATRALDMAWELARQGFNQPRVLLRQEAEGHTTWVVCGGREDGEYPKVDGDFAAYWAVPSGRIPHILSIANEIEGGGDEYWWLFD
jgi:hypothetical protein